MGTDVRVGGLRVDPATAQWQSQAALNSAALTKKQRADRQRTRGRYDLPEWLKVAVEAVAEEQETSASQMASFLIAWALRDYLGDDQEMLDAILGGKSRARTLRFESNLDIPRHLVTEIKAAIAAMEVE
jgi:hypothetical protein